MANVTTLALGGTTTGASGRGDRPVVIMTHEINIADAVTAGLTNAAYVTVVNIPADTYFRFLQCEVVTALSLGSGARIDLGDAQDDDELVSNATVLTAGTNLTLLKNDLTDGLIHADAETLKLKVTGDTIATGLIRFVWEQADTSRNPKAIAGTV